MRARIIASLTEQTDRMRRRRSTRASRRSTSTAATLATARSRRRSISFPASTTSTRTMTSRSIPSHSRRSTAARSGARAASRPATTRSRSMRWRRPMRGVRRARPAALIDRGFSLPHDAAAALVRGLRRAHAALSRSCRRRQSLRLDDHLRRPERPALAAGAVRGRVWRAAQAVRSACGLSRGASR